jgi:methylthioribulose-1-phosphate dehydratase
MADMKRPPTPAEELAETGRDFYGRGWVLGAGGNFSVLLARKPMRLYITSAGNEKSTLDDTNFLEIDDDAEILQGFGTPSDETLLHLTIYRLRPRARCILYSHSVSGTVLADRYFTDGSVAVRGYEVLKGLEGVDSHEHLETIPIVENSQDLVALSHVVENVLIEQPDIRAILIRRNGLYTWGTSVDEARRNVEIFEFLFDIQERSR